jgi:UDP-glucose 4-epimerase
MVISKYRKQESFSSVYDGLRVVVLGATGFIGRWVARELCAKGASVSTIVRDKKRADEIFSKYQIHAKIYEVDLIDNDQILTLFKKIRPCVTFNLAGYGVDKTENESEMAYRINSELVSHISRAQYEICDRNWEGRDLIHVGSAFEYGNTGGDLNEASDPTPITIYGQSKLTGTRNLQKFCDESGLKGVTARLFTVYGPGEHQGRLLPSLLETARTRKYLELTTGEQKRDFTYVPDVARGLIQLAVSPASPDRIVNLCTGRLNTVRRFVETAAQIMNISLDRLKFGAIPTKLDEMQHSEVSTERLQRLIGWIPMTNINKGILGTKLFVESHRL